MDLMRIYLNLTLYSVYFLEILSQRVKQVLNLIKDKLVKYFVLTIDSETHHLREIIIIKKPDC